MSIENAPADAKAVGDKFKSIKTDWNSVTDKPSTFPATWDSVNGKPSSYPPSAHNHSKLAFENDNEVNFVGTPDDNTVYWGYRDNTIDEYRFNDGRGSGALANVRANKFIGSLEGNANTATKATGVTDYNNSGKLIQVGWEGAGLNTSNLTHIAGYTDNGTKIKDVSKDVLKSWLGLDIVASGSNYIRFGDGTQICWYAIDSDGSDYTWSFPVAFSNTGYSIVSCPVSMLSFVCKDKRTTSCTLPGTNDTLCHGIAVGRWK